MKALLTLCLLLSASLANAQSNNGCVRLPGLHCQQTPGLSEGQKFKLATDIKLTPGTQYNSWNYFVNGEQINIDALVAKEGQDYCAIHETQDKLPQELQKDGVRTFPAALSPYTLNEISWYVPTVFFESKETNGSPVGFVVSCGTIENHEIEKNEATSLNAIQKHFKGLIELQQ